MAQVNEGGIGICGVLFIVFLVLKMTGVIAWSWWWVTAPLWAPFVVLFSVLGIWFTITMLVGVFSSEGRRRR